jgi:hypothetical protein
MCFYMNEREKNLFLKIRNFASLRTQISFISLAIPAQHRGAFRDRHERRAGDAMDAGCAADESATLRTAKSCGPDASMVGVKSAELSAGDGDNKARSPGRARNKPLTPSRAGMPGDPGATVVTNARVYYTPRAAAGATGTRHSPLPPWGSPTPSRGRSILASLGRIALRERGRIS